MYVCGVLLSAALCKLSSICEYDYRVETYSFLIFILQCFFSFFFFKQKTAYEMRISDWSSDVCSSDLNPVAAVHIARDPRYIERLAAIVALEQADRIGDEPPLVDQPPDAERRLQAQRDFGEHVGELQLHDLVRRERAPELLALAGVTPRRFITKLRRTHRAPADAVTRAVEAAERPFQTRHLLQQRLPPALHPAPPTPPAHRAPQAHLAPDLGRIETPPS